jgi:hypothetical protein
MFDMQIPCIVQQIIGGCKSALHGGSQGNYAILVALEPCQCPYTCDKQPAITKLHRNVTIVIIIIIICWLQSDRVN